MAPFKFPRKDDDELVYERQKLPVANLPQDFDGVPEDGMQYLFTVRRDARSLPHVTRVPNPYEVPKRLPSQPPSDILPVAVQSALPSPEWRSLFETRYRNFRKNLAQPTIQVSQPVGNDNRRLLPHYKDRDCWWAFLSGRPTEEWDLPKKPNKQNKFQRGMRAFAEDDSKIDEGFSAGSSRTAEAPETRSANDDTEAQPAPPESCAATPVYTPREPTPSLLRLIDQRMALHLLMYFTYWTNLHMQPERRFRVTQTHARWIFALLSRVDDYITADETNLLRNLARAYLALLKALIHSAPERVSAEDMNPACCWLIISTVVGIWGQRDLWMDAEEIVRSKV
ncbi:hypothetical protein MSAN_01465900 [Mycena sanguinolenta]|uniref:Uncharacterized protein n=1 Tax=Mycena sanguinolenta TaxID=230812 RepID=A0A8H6YCD9_9AGAR|nr:hypothetical protein MSAN_01465900 [Mycena sanguinolenta]